MKAQKSIIYILSLALALFTLPVQSAPEHCEDMTETQATSMSDHSHHQMVSPDVPPTVEQSSEQSHDCCGETCQCNFTSCQNATTAILMLEKHPNFSPTSGFISFYSASNLSAPPPSIEYPPQIIA